MYELVSEKPTRGMLVKIPLYGDVSEKPMMGMIYPFSAGTLTFVRTIEMFVEIFYHRFFSFAEDD
jgi:zinc transporter ZupT